MNTRLSMILPLGFLTLALVVACNRQQWLGDDQTAAPMAQAKPAQQASMPTANFNFASLREQIDNLQNGTGDTQQLLGQLHTQLQAVQKRLTDLERLPPAAGATSAAVDAAAAAGTDQQSPLSPEQQDQQETSRMEQQLSLMGRTLANQERDGKWAPVATEMLQLTYGTGVTPGVSLVDSDCRSTFCKVELSLDGSLSTQDSFANLMHASPWPGQSFVKVGDGPHADITLYVAREGQQLPRLPAADSSH